MPKISRRQFRAWLRVKLSSLAYVLERSAAQIDAYQDKDFIVSLEKILKEAKQKYKNMADIIIRVEATPDVQGVNIYYVPDISEAGQRLKQILVHSKLELRDLPTRIAPQIDIRFDSMEILSAIEKLIKTK